MKYSVLIIVFCFSVFIYPQVENVSADNPVYEFLKELQVKGILEDYDDFIIPHSKESVINYLIQIEQKKDLLSNTEKKYLQKLLERFKVTEEGESVDIFDDFPSGFFSNIISEKQKHLYHYEDSTLSFYINPVAELKLIYSGENNTNSSFIYYGGNFNGSYDNWLGFYLQGTIGIQSGNREAALLDKRVYQSFTFNDTKLKYFDDSEGYIRLKKGIASIQFGRERTIWGNGYINKMILSDNPPKFDFLKFDLKYKSFSYNFLHGWLVHTPNIIFVDSLIREVKEKPSKYIAVSRLGFQPNNSISVGVSQVIIYGNRPLEAAYLNPFLYWESAQRSMNDLDNSFLSLDGRFLVTDGIEIIGSIILDDINLEIWSKGDWSHYHNRWAWQTGTYITHPFLPQNVTLQVEYLQLRPYIFSHYGLYDNSLTYTTNGYLLGFDLQPNSTRFSAGLNFRVTENLNLSLKFKHSLHGSNLYDKNGELIKSYGGDVFRTLTSFDEKHVKLLEGEREKNNNFTLSAEYEFFTGLFLSAEYQHNSYTIKNTTEKHNYFWGSFRVDLNN